MPTLTRLSLMLLVLTFAPTLLGLAALSAQTSPTFEGLVEVSEVLIDVLATDENGEAVLGLGKDDFVLEEGGRPVDITGVDYYSTRYTSASTAEGETGNTEASDGEIPSSRYLILFFHDTTLRHELSPRSIRQQLEAGRKSQEWVETGLKGSDWVAVVSFDYSLKVHQDFTQDRDTLLFAIEMAISRQHPDKHSPRRRAAPSGTPSVLRRLPKGKQLRRESRSIYDAMRVLGESTGPIVGRKNLLLFTFGIDPQVPFSRSRNSREYLKMEMVLNDRNVAVYPIHLGGRGVGQSGGYFLSELAEDTGGVYYENIKDYSVPLEAIGNANHGYYVLSYSSEHPAGEIGYERVEVKALREGIEVRARKGYRYGL